MTETLAEELCAELRGRRGESLELYRRYLNPGFVELLGMVGYGRRFVRASGGELEDERGRRYLDFLSGYGVLGLGHNHPALAATLRALLGEELPGFTHVDASLLEGLAAERLARALPGDLDKLFFCSSGSEAVEAALKLARAATGRKRVLALAGAYHGSTLGALALTDNPALRDRFRPLPPGLEAIPFGDLGALRRTLRWGDVAALLVEPVQGEGGARVLPAGYLEEALALCRAHGALLVCDEVQTGLGRTGRLFAVEHEGVVPDAICLAKVLGGGLMPVGALAARGEVFARAYGSLATCTQHGATFGGGPLAMGAVIATLEVIRRERLVANADEQGSYLAARLGELAAAHPGAIAEVRGRGLLLGVRFNDVARGLLDGPLLGELGRASAALFAQHVALRLIEEHAIVTQVAVNDPSVLKVMPPLAVGRAECDRFVDALRAVLGAGGHAAALAGLAAAFIKHKLYES
jgi:putrescine aminotransferase